jgi:hypothetical protein
MVVQAQDPSKIASTMQAILFLQPQVLLILTNSPTAILLDRQEDNFIKGHKPLSSRKYLNRATHPVGISL